MSELHNHVEQLKKLGYSNTAIANVENYMPILIKTNKLNIVSINAGHEAYNSIYRILSNDVNKLVSPVLSKVYGYKCYECNWTGHILPEFLIVNLPDGRNVQANYFFNGTFEWEYDDNGNIVRGEKLYGDRDILAYDYNPLDRLKFRCLPNEKLSYSINEEDGLDEEYSGKAPVFLGIELEVEKTDKTPRKIEHRVIEDLDSSYALLKHDGTLQNGFEIVTAPATIGFHLKAWDKFFNNSAKFLSSWASGRCGMHVHVTRKAITPMHLGKILSFINNEENRKFITTIAGRHSPKYAEFRDNGQFQIKSHIISRITELTDNLRIEKDATKLKQIESVLYDYRTRLKAGARAIDILREIEGSIDTKYCAINLKKPHTIEFRIFRGNVSKVGMLKNLEFTHAVIEFTRDATFRTKALTVKEIKERQLKRKENTDYALHHTFFIDWLSKDNTGNYNNLKHWLQTYRLTDKFIRKGDTDKTPVDKRLTDSDIAACA